MPDVTRREMVTTSGSNTQVTTYCNGYVESSSGQVSSTFPRRKTRKIWQTTPGYIEKRKAKARLPDLPFQFQLWEQTEARVTRSSYSSSPCGSNGWDVASNRVSTTAFYNDSDPTSGESATLSTAAVHNRLLAKAKGAEFNLPVFFGEAGETARLVLGIAQNFARAFSRIRRGDLVNAYIAITGHGPSRSQSRRFNNEFGRSPKEAAANAWLGLQFGWVPLLHDVKSAAERLAEFAVDSAATVGTVRASQTIESDTYESVPFDVSNNIEATLRTVRKESIRAVWKFQPTGMNVLGSLGLLNPFSVAWELMPLSWAVDYMLPVGRYLESLDAPLRFLHLGGTLGRRIEVAKTWSNLYSTNPGVAVSGSRRTFYVGVTRTPYTQAPSLGLESVFFDPKIGARRLTNLLAVSAQRFRF